jgi:hypothetical protein
MSPAAASTGASKVQAASVAASTRVGSGLLVFIMRHSSTLIGSIDDLVLSVVLVDGTEEKFTVPLFKSEHTSGG